MQDVLLYLLTASIDSANSADSVESPSLEAFWSAHLTRSAAWSSPFDRALVGGLAADRLGFAFATGYHAALRALLPALPDDRIVALCATEEGGAHPRAIRTALVNDGGRLLLRGKKRWSTMSPAASELLVVASTGEDASGKNRLRVVRIDARSPGVTILPMPPAPFAPEIPHAEVELKDVPVAPEAVLEGDGYDNYLKPFRTIEDIHVYGAALGYLVGVARRYGAPEALIARLAAAVLCARTIAGLDPKAPQVHVALAGILDESRRLAAEIDAIFGAAKGEAGPGEGKRENERARWERDRTLLEVAQKARTARRDRAFEALSIRRSPAD